MFIKIKSCNIIIELNKDWEEVERSIRKKERWAYKKAIKLGVTLKVISYDMIKNNKQLVNRLEKVWEAFVTEKNLPLRKLIIDKNTVILLALVNEEIAGFFILKLKKDIAYLDHVPVISKYKKYQITSFLYYNALKFA